MENLNNLKNQLPESTSPPDAEADYLDMATHYENTNQLELAEEYYKKASAEGEGFASIYLADLYLKQGKVDLAEEWYRKESGENDSCYGDGNNALAHFLVEQGREEEAWEYLLYVLFENYADTAPYEGALVLAWDLLEKGKCWDKMTEEVFYIAYTFWSTYFCGDDGIRFVEEKLQECIENDAPNAQDAAYILANLYFKGEYRVTNYEGFYTDNIIRAPFLMNKEKGATALEKMDEDNLSSFVSSCRKDDDLAALEVFVDVFGYAYNSLQEKNNYSVLWELANVFIEYFLGDETISDTDLIELCKRISNCSVWDDIINDVDDFGLDEDLSEHVPHQRIAAIYEEIAPLRDGDEFYSLGCRYQSAGQYDKALEAYKKCCYKTARYTDLAAAEIAQYYIEGRPGIPQCFQTALDWAVIALMTPDAELYLCNIVGERPEEKCGMWKELFSRLTSNPTPGIIKYFWSYSEDFEECYTPEDFHTALTALAECGDERAKRLLQEQA